MDQVNEKNKRKKHRKNDKTKKSIKGAKQFEKKKDCNTTVLCPQRERQVFKRFFASTKNRDETRTVQGSIC